MLLRLVLLWPELPPHQTRRRPVSSETGGVALYLAGRLFTRVTAARIVQRPLYGVISSARHGKNSIKQRKLRLSERMIALPNLPRIQIEP